MATHTIGTGTTTFDGVVEGVNPGDLIKVTSSAGRDHLKLENIAGASGNEVIVVNDGGVVVIDCSTNSRIWGLHIDNCQYMKVLGIGHAHEWGFEITEHSNAGLYIHNQSEFCTFENIEISDSTGAGIRSQTYWPAEAASSFVIDGLEFRNMYIHAQGDEAAYIGKRLSDGKCQHNDLVFEYCIIDDNDKGGIQLRHITATECQRNWVTNNGSGVDDVHAGGGLNIGDDTASPMGGHWRYNYVYNCERGVMFLTDDVDVEVHHNLFVECGDTGGVNDPQGGFQAQNGVENNFRAYNNTIVNCGVAAGGYGAKTKGGDTDGELEDNIVVGSDDDIDSDWTLTNNETGTVANQNFRSGDAMYHLTESSPDATCGWMPWV